MKVGLIGKRSSGKSTLFECVTGLDKKNIQGSLITPAKVKVPDIRIDFLSAIFRPKSTVYAEFDVLDYNRSMDASDAMLGSSSLVAKYRELDALIFVIGVIDDFSFVKSEFDDLLSELMFLDLMIVEAKIERMKKGKYEKREMQVMEELVTKLEARQFPDKKTYDQDTLKILSAFQLLSLKPIMVVVNIAENLMHDVGKQYMDFGGVPYEFISAEIERELNQLSADEQKSFLEDLGLNESLKGRFIRKVYETIDYISFFTMGPDEVRAWNIFKSSPALKAAGRIHSDIERGFIKAEVIHYDEFMEIKDEVKARSVGKIRSEGKEYIVKDGDIINFKFNV